MLCKLAALRMERGYCTKKSFVAKLNHAGININNQTYNRIESGKQKIDVKTAIVIADFLRSSVKDIFLPIETQKMSRNDFD